MPDFIGWVGAIFLLLAYSLTTFKVLPVTSNTANLFNIIGAGLLAISASQHNADALLFINVVWLAIAVVNLIRNSFETRRQA